MIFQYSFVAQIEKLCKCGKYESLSRRRFLNLLLNEWFAVKRNDGDRKTKPGCLLFVLINPLITWMHFVGEKQHCLSYINMLHQKV